MRSKVVFRVLRKGSKQGSEKGRLACFKLVFITCLKTTLTGLLAIRSNTGFIDISGCT